MPEQVEPSARSCDSTESFKAALLDFIIHRLPQLTKPLNTQEPITATTPLFETGIIDSMGILHLIAFIEAATAQRIPTKLVVMNRFRTVNAIAENFGPGAKARSS